MKTYNVERFDESIIMVVKHDQEGYYKVAQCGARVLFDFNNYRFLDTSDADDNEHYLILDFNGIEEGNPNGYYELELKPFYDLVALYLTGENTHEILLEEIENITSEDDGESDIINVDFSRTSY
jgi:hypothetical protein